MKFGREIKLCDLTNTVMVKLCVSQKTVPANTFQLTDVYTCTCTKNEDWKTKLDLSVSFYALIASILVKVCISWKISTNTSIYELNMRNVKHEELHVFMSDDVISSFLQRSTCTPVLLCCTIYMYM